LTNLIDENTQEVLVAIPFAYEKMELAGLALEGFRKAEANYLDELRTLELVISSVQGYDILEALNIDRSTDIDWLTYASQNNLSPRLSYLIQLFSREEFLGLVQELRDLLAIQVQFREWQDKVIFYTAMLDEREQNRAAELDWVAREELAEKIRDMEAQRDMFAQKLARVIDEQDFLAVVDKDNSAKIERILNAEKNAELLKRASTELGLEVMPEDELAELTETLRKQKGFMIWRSIDSYEQRLWRAKYELASVNEALSSMRKTQASVKTILDQGLDLQPIRKRIASANDALAIQITDIDYAVEQSQNALRTQVLRVLQNQHVRLKHYLAQSRLSIARLMDQAAQAETPESESSGDDEGGDQAVTPEGEGP